MGDRVIPALLLGADRLLGLQLARILRGHGIPTIGVAIDPGSHYCRTRALTEVLPFDVLQVDPEGVCQSLGETYGGRPVLIPCLDELVWWLDEHRALLARHGDFVLSDSETLARLGDKSRFYRFAAEHGLRLPDTRFVRAEEELEDAARALGFPLVIKPPRRSPEWMARTGGFKVLRADDAESLARVAPGLLEVVDELILQRWVHGGDDHMVSLFVCLDRESRPIVPSLVARKLRQWPPDIGVGSLAQEVRDDALVEQGHALLRELGYVGPGSLQFKRDARTGEAFVIEMNVRPALSFPLFEACGVEATRSLYRLAAGLPIVPQREIPRPGSKWICWKRDLASAFVHWRRGDLTIGAWLASLRGRKRSADVVLSDPMPILADLGLKLRRGLSQRTRRLLGRAP